MQSGKRRLVSIRQVYLPEDTLFYDIQVAGNHLFQLSNGAVSHNCDFSRARREEIRTYLEKRFGKEHVLAVATYGGSGVRGALQDLGRHYEIPKPEVDAVTTALDRMTKYEAGDDEDEKTNVTFEWLRQNVPGADELLKKYPYLETWVPIYEPVYRNLGKHAAALVVCDQPIASLIPVVKHAKSGEVMTALREGTGTKELQPQGLMKLDFLGLANVDVVHDAEKFVERRYGEKLRELFGSDKFDEKTWHRIGYDTPFCQLAYRLAQIGELDGIFQLDGPAGRRTTAIVQPSSFGEIVFISAALRPGAAKAHAAETFAEAKKGRWPEGYPDYRELRNYGVDERFISFMAETLGISVYQEQIMQFLHYVADIPMSGANKVRKVIGVPPEKRKPENYAAIEKARQMYLKGALKRGLSQELADSWWETVVGQAEYSFNKSHCVAYSIITFRELFLKSIFPTEFYASLLKNISVSDKKKEAEKINQTIISALRIGVKIEPPDINQSAADITISDDGRILLGFASLKRVGDLAVRDIVARQPYTSFADFLAKHIGTGSRCYKPAIVALICANAFRNLGEDRATLLVRYFEDRKEYDKVPATDPLALLRLEQEYVKFIFTEHELMHPTGDKAITLEQAALVNDSEPRLLFGLIEEIEKRKSKAGREFWTVKVTNLRTSIKVYCWSEAIGKLVEKKDYKTKKTTQYGVKKGDGLYFYARRTERGWNMLFPSSAIPSLREHYAQADRIARAQAADLARSAACEPKISGSQGGLS